MRTSCNPGSWLEVTGSFDLEANQLLPHGLDDRVRNRETGSVITLFSLLRSFLEDPSDTVTGPIKITIEPVRPER